MKTGTEIIEVLEIEERRFELEQRRAKAYTTSQMLPAHLRDIGSMMVLGQMSRELRLPMLMLAQNIYMVKGKVGMSAQLVITLINGSGKYDNDIEFEERVEPFGVRAFAFKDEKRVEGIWIDEAMIVVNGWYSNTNWKTLKPLMARYRAATYFARLNCPEVLLGFQTDEEIKDANQVEAIDIKEVISDPINKVVAEDEAMQDISEDIEEADLEDDFMETPPVEIKNKVKKATKKVASKYEIMMRVGFKAGHLSQVVKYFQLNDENINAFVSNMEDLRDEFYSAHPNIHPNAIPEPESPEGQPEKESEGDGKGEAETEPYLVPSDVVAHYGDMIVAGVMRPDLADFCKTYEFDSDTIEMALDSMKDLVSQYYKNKKA